MPPPSIRCSPSRESRPRHKNDRSLEGGLSFKEKDDDLALFNEVQSKEQDMFLLQSMDDLEDILSTNLKPLAVTIPARGEVGDLLNVDEDKNDYEWLLTPPDTPLFPSLDDEQIPVNLVHNGRPRSRRTSISGSPTMEKSYNSRGSASPQHLSPSPRSSVSSAFQSRGRPSSAPRGSPTPSSRHSTPTRRSPGPSVKPSTPPFRSSTPTPRRLSTGSGVGFSSGVRGASPVSSSRGSSSSPKIRAWQSNIPGFSLEAPPNLCTSLADRPSSFVRGSSPASRNSRNSSPMVRRQSMSPTATRRVNSPHSHERDRFNSRSKGSVNSSGYDDADSFLSGNGGLSSSRPITFSKRPAKVVTPSSAPKRSFDTAIRHMDRRTPQNMFRPLLSSVPTTTFYGDKATSSHYTVESMNSSVTTSSNASSDQAAIGAPDIESSEHNQYDMESKFAKIPNIDDLNGEIFSFDKMDKFHEDTLEIHDQSPDIQLGEFHEASAFEPKPGDLNCSNSALYAEKGYAQAESHVDSILCSKCGCIYNVTELVEDEVNICPECKEKEGIMVNSIASRRLDIAQSTPDPTTKILEEVGSSNASVPYLATPKSSEVTETSKSVIDLHIISGQENVSESNATNQELSKGFCLDNSSAGWGDEGNTHMLSDVMATPDPSTVSVHVPPSKIDVAEGAGISVLLIKRSSSSKGPVIQGRGFAASSVSYDVRSYARESTLSMRSSSGHGSASMSSSTDMSSSQISQGLGLAANVQEENIDARVFIEGPVFMDEPETSYKLPVALENIQKLDRGNDNHALELKIDVSGNESECSSFPLLTVDEVQNLAAIDDPILKKVAYGNPEELAATLGSSSMDESAALNNPAKEIEVLQTEVVEAPHNDWVGMCEIKIEDFHSSGSKGNVVSSDALQEPTPMLHDHKDASGSASRSNEYAVVPSILEESKVMVEDQEGRRTRSLTLDEAADTVLFCSSIVHSLAYEAATIAINKENENMIPLEALRPAVIIKDRHISDTTDQHFRSIRKRTPKSHKGRHRREEEEEKEKTDLHLSKMEEDDSKPDEPTFRNVGLPHNMESSKPPKLESKCNCTVM